MSDPQKDAGLRTTRLTPPIARGMLAGVMGETNGSRCTEDADIDLSVDLAGLRLSCPILTASGTCGYGPEMAELVDLAQLGAFVTKAISPEPRKGNPPERIVETPGGMLNAIGLANIGLQRFIDEQVPFWQTQSVPVIVNVVGHSVDDFVTVARGLDPIDCIAGLELNVSCPNVADGLEFGTDPQRLRGLVGAVRAEAKRTKLIVKLSPNVTDITTTALAAIDAGADALSMINTLCGMAINVETWRPRLANRTGGLSGPAVKPVALYLIHKVYQQVARRAGVPIIGMGGISDCRDAVEFFLAGASAVAVGTALFRDPRTPLSIRAGLSDYLRERKLRSISELVGQLK